MLPNNFPARLQGNPGAPPTPLCLFVFPISSSVQTVTQSQNQGHGKREASPISSTCFRGKQTRTHVLVSPELADSTSSQPLTKRALIQMPALSAQLRAVWVQNQPAQEGLLATVHALPGHTEGQRYFPYDWWPSPVAVTGPPSEW